MPVADCVGQLQPVADERVAHAPQNSGRGWEPAREAREDGGHGCGRKSPDCNRRGKTLWILMKDHAPVKSPRSMHLCNDDAFHGRQQSDMVSLAMFFTACRVASVGQGKPPGITTESPASTWLVHPVTPGTAE